MRPSKKPDANTKKTRPPGTTIEARENQMTSLAFDLAEKHLMNGTASSQIITHYLKIGSSKDRLEKEILEEQKKLISAKTEAIKSSKVQEELYKEALKAMRTYSGDMRGDEDVD